MDKASRVAQSMRDHVCRPRAATKDKSIFGNILHDQCRRGVSTKMAGQQCEICDQLGHVWATPYGLEQTTNARTFKLVLPSRRRWHHLCHSVGQLAQLKQPIWKPNARLHVRADLPAMTDQSRVSKQQKAVKKIAKNPAIHLHAFQDVRVFAAALNADANPSDILFNALLEKDLRDDNGKIEQLPKHTLNIVHSLLVDGVVRNTSTLKIVVEEVARRLQAPYPVISDLFLEDSAHAFSSEIRRHRGALPNECGHETKSHGIQLGQTLRVDCCVCKMCVLFGTARVRSKYKDGCDGQQTFFQTTKCKVCE